MNLANTINIFGWQPDWNVSPEAQTVGGSFRNAVVEYGELLDTAHGWVNILKYFYDMIEIFLRK